MTTKKNVKTEIDTFRYGINFDEIEQLEEIIYSLEKENENLTNENNKIRKGMNELNEILRKNTNDKRLIRILNRIGLNP